MPRYSDDYKERVKNLNQLGVVFSILLLKMSSALFSGLISLLTISSSSLSLTPRSLAVSNPSESLPFTIDAAFVASVSLVVVFDVEAVGRGFGRF